MRLRAILIGCLALFAGPAAAQQTLTMAELSADPFAFADKEVTISDCLLLSLNDTVGGQCTSVPMSAWVLTYIDPKTWAPETREVLYACPLDDILALCVLEVTGTALVDPAGRVRIANARVVDAGRASAF